MQPVGNGNKTGNNGNTNNNIASAVTTAWLALVTALATESADNLHIASTARHSVFRSERCVDRMNDEITGLRRHVVTARSDKNKAIKDTSCDFSRY